jgi:DNA-binding XRE family transcriptional regulator
MSDRWQGMKPSTFSELFKEAERHDDYWVAGCDPGVHGRRGAGDERQGMTRAELARRLGATPAYVTKILRGSANFTLDTMVRLARALDAELHVPLTPDAGRHAHQEASDASDLRPRRVVKFAAARNRPTAKTCPAPRPGASGGCEEIAQPIGGECGGRSRGKRFGKQAR